MSPRRFDALVVGAGPAGSVAALVLARAGARVALLDKARFPRDKACGDFIGPRGLQVLADLGIPEPPGLDAFRDDLDSGSSSLNLSSLLSSGRLVHG